MTRTALAVADPCSARRGGVFSGLNCLLDADHDGPHMTKDSTGKVYYWLDRRR